MISFKNLILRLLVKGMFNWWLGSYSSICLSKRKVVFFGLWGSARVCKIFGGIETIKCFVGRRETLEKFNVLFGFRFWKLFVTIPRAIFYLARDVFSKGFCGLWFFFFFCMLLLSFIFFSVKVVISIKKSKLTCFNFSATTIDYNSLGFLIESSYF